MTVLSVDKYGEKEYNSEVTIWAAGTCCRCTRHARVVMKIEKEIP